MFEYLTKQNHFIENLSYIVSSFAILFFVINYLVTKNKIQIEAIARCIDSYRRIILNNSIHNKSVLSEYLDLINEEIFYFENGYIPLNVMIEWFEGILEYLPIIKNVNKETNQYEYYVIKDIINSNNHIGGRINNDIVKQIYNYPRIVKLLEITGNEEKDNVSLLILNHLEKLNPFYKIKLLIFFRRILLKDIEKKSFEILTLKKSEFKVH